VVVVPRSGFEWATYTHLESRQLLPNAPTPWTEEGMQAVFCDLRVHSHDLFSPIAICCTHTSCYSWRAAHFPALPHHPGPQLAVQIWPCEAQLHLTNGFERSKWKGIRCQVRMLTHCDRGSQHKAPANSGVSSQLSRVRLAPGRMPSIPKSFHLTPPTSTRLSGQAQRRPHPPHGQARRTSRLTTTHCKNSLFKRAIQTNGTSSFARCTSARR